MEDNMNAVNIETPLCSHFDIGVMGFWYSCNYGSMLTYYALNNVLTDMGKSVLMIDKPAIFPHDIEYTQLFYIFFAQFL